MGARRQPGRLTFRAPRRTPSRWRHPGAVHRPAASGRCAAGERPFRLCRRSVQDQPDRSWSTRTRPMLACRCDNRHSTCQRAPGRKVSAPASALRDRRRQTEMYQRQRVLTFLQQRRFVCVGAWSRMLKQRWTARRRRLVFAPAGRLFEWAYFSQGRRVLLLNMVSLRFHGQPSTLCFSEPHDRTQRPQRTQRRKGVGTVHSLR